MTPLKELMEISFRENHELLQISNQILKKYTGNLDKLIDEITEVTNRDNIDNVSAQSLEYYCAKIPSFLYYLTTGLEETGIKMDAIEQDRKKKYNEIYLMTEGTAAKKKAAAEIETHDYALAAIIYKRAYNCMKEKMDEAQKLYEAIKKILTKRISERDISNKDNYTP